MNKQPLSDFTERALDFQKAIAARGTMPNALIVNGPDEQLCRSYSITLAASVACNGDAKPCFACESCRRILNKISPDIIDVFPEDGKQSINVDQARHIRQDAYIAPSELEFKVYLLHDADKMNSATQNALLKILEEPPSFASFVLLSSNTAAFLPTVKSRCQSISIEPLVSKKSGKRSKPYSLADETLRILSGNRKSEMVDLSVSMPSDRQEYKDYIIALMRAFRDILAYKSGSTDIVFFDSVDSCGEYSSRFSENAVLRAYDALERSLIENDANIYILLSQTRLCSCLWRSIHP